MSEYKEMISFFATVIIVGLILASCTMFERKQQADVMKACLERVENVAECVWFDRNR
ncbi:MAG: hypothetical protein IT328_06010 [Caldilineaceae bacterium]|nr:hypothetical protein [Caldilineaceae bacterium]